MINDYEATQPITTDAVPVEPVDTEPMSTTDVISSLNGLIETCKDGQNGFKEAAEGIDRSDLKALFNEFSQQRAEFSAVLQELVRNLGGDPEKSGSIAGAAHRGWINIKSAVTGGGEESILNECERGEDFAKDAYADALQLELPANIADVIRQQSQAVTAAHNRVRELRNSERHETASSSS